MGNDNYFIRNCIPYLMNIEYHHPTEDDVEAMTEIINSSAKDLKHSVDNSVELVRTWTFGEKDYDPKGYLIGFAGSQPVVYGGSTISKSRLDNGHNDASVSLAVIPEWRYKSIEGHMFNATFKFLRSRGIDSARFFTPEASGWRNNMAMEIGMEDIRHGYLMTCKNQGQPLNLPTPDGFQFHHKMLDESSDSEISDFVDAFNDSFANHYNFSPSPVERFIKVRDEEAKTGECKLRLTFAKKGDEIVGVCFYEINHQYNKQNNSKAGWANILGVRKPFRSLGLGRALLADAMCWFHEKGMDTIYLGVDAENSKALDLYLSLGYAVEQEGIHYELIL